MPLPPTSFEVAFFDSDKITFLDVFDMYLIVFVVFIKHVDIFSQYLVTYLVSGVKRLPGGIFDLSGRPGPPGCYYRMQSTVIRLVAKPGCREVSFRQRSLNNYILYHK